jgi:phage anti-repressor protein
MERRISLKEAREIVIRQLMEKEKQYKKDCIEYNKQYNDIDEKLEKDYTKMKPKKIKNRNRKKMDTDEFDI